MSKYSDKELADKLVEDGIGIEYQTGGHYSYSRSSRWLLPREFVRDWRVAGMCLEKWPTTINVEHLPMTLNEMLRDPRAICLAYVEAMEENNETK